MYLKGGNIQRRYIANMDFRLNNKISNQQIQPQASRHSGSDELDTHVQIQSTLPVNMKSTVPNLAVPIISGANTALATATLTRMRHLSISKCEGTNLSNADWRCVPRPDSNLYATLTRDSKKRLATTGKLTLPLRTGSEPPVGRKVFASAALNFAPLASSSAFASAAAGASSVSASSSSSASSTFTSQLADSQSRLAQLSGRLTFDDSPGVPCQSADLRVDRELGQGVCGVVSMATHLPTGRRLAVKAMRLHFCPGPGGFDCSTGLGGSSGGSEERRRVLNDLEVAGKCRDCPHIVQFYGAVLCQSEVWICMELMATCLDRLLRCSGHRGLSEPVLGKVVVPVLRALHYLKERHNLIHRDVKPSNVLLSWRGQVKLCDFGISGQLVNSKAHTRTAGCIAYLAPERITLTAAYDIRSDVWSLGMTLVELATGRHPLAGCTCEMELLTRIVDDPPPQLPRLAAGTGCTFSDHFRDFVAKCLMKDVNLRPKYQRLLCHDFVKYHEQTQTDLAEWLAELMVRYPDLNVDSVIARRRKLSAASSQGSSSGYGSADTNSPSSLQS